MSWKPKDDFTTEQKVKAFDRLRKEALAIFDMHRERIEAGLEPSEKETDRVECLGESALTETLGKDLFKQWDKP